MRPLKVFLCHASDDKLPVRALYQQLTAAGVTPWLDEEDLLPGHDWESEIRKAVKASDVVLVCLSEKSLGKAGFVQKEIRFALDVADEQPEGTIFLIPLRLELCTVPDRINRWHWCSLFEDQGFEKLLRALRSRAENLGLTPPVASIPAAKPSPVPLPSKPERSTELATSKMPIAPVPVQQRQDVTNVNSIDGTELILIPAGEFLMGSDDGPKRERPQHLVNLPEYYIAKYPVTNAKYARFVEATGLAKPWLWDEKRFNQPNQPVVGVTWHDAVAYCKWAGLRLPTEAEWEKAARGTDGRKWPWGNEPPSEKRCNFGSKVGATTEVGSYPDGASPFGCLEMAGNVWEWCATKWRASYNKDPGESLEGTAGNVLRGGSFYNSADSVRCASRCGVLPVFWVPTWGFRCAQ